MNISKNALALITAGFIATNFGWSAELGYSEEDQLEIIKKNATFDNHLSDWGSMEFTFLNNTLVPCTIQADDQCKITVGANSSWNFPRRGAAYFSLLLKDGLGVFHIDPKSTDGTQHMITLDPFRPEEEMKKMLNLFESKGIVEMRFENNTDTNCTIRLNEGCEYSIAAKSVYEFYRKNQHHHALNLISGEGDVSLEDLGGGRYRIALNPVVTTFVDELLERADGHAIGSSDLATALLAKELSGNDDVSDEEGEILLQDHAVLTTVAADASDEIVE